MIFISNFIYKVLQQFIIILDTIKCTSKCSFKFFSCFFHVFFFYQLNVKFVSILSLVEGLW